MPHSRNGCYKCFLGLAFIRVRNHWKFKNVLIFKRISVFLVDFLLKGNLHSRLESHRFHVAIIRSCKELMHLKAHEDQICLSWVRQSAQCTQWGRCLFEFEYRMSHRYWANFSTYSALLMFCLLNPQTNACEPNPKTTRSDFNRWKSVTKIFCFHAISTDICLLF